MLMTARKQCRYNRSASQSGFTLIETAILITVLSLILVPLFIFLQTEQRRKALYEQENVNDRVLSAISLFLQQNGRYPCPAQPSAALNTANFGVEQTAGAGLLGPANVRIGSIPVKALNISVTDSMNKDGWRYIYAVSREKCETANVGNPNRISIRDAANVAVGTAPFVIVNIGKDGKGGWNLNGQLSAIPCDATTAAADDYENCDNDSTFREGLYSIAQLPNQAGFYDDSIAYSLATSESTMWKVKENTGAGAGAIDIVTRSTGMVGIGTTAPASQVDIDGGNMQVLRDNGTGGLVDLDNGDVTANVDVNSDLVTSNTGAESPAFYYDTP